MQLIVPGGLSKNADEHNVTIYPENEKAGESGAARLALSTLRPVAVNNTIWFKDLEDDRRIVKLENNHDLVEWLESLKKEFTMRNRIFLWDDFGRMLLDNVAEKIIDKKKTLAPASV